MSERDDERALAASAAPLHRRGRDVVAQAREEPGRADQVGAECPDDDAAGARGQRERDREREVGGDDQRAHARLEPGPADRAHVGDAGPGREPGRGGEHEEGAEQRGLAVARAEPGVDQRGQGGGADARAAEHAEHPQAVELGEALLEALAVAGARRRARTPSGRGRGPRRRAAARRRRTARRSRAARPCRAWRRCRRRACRSAS